MDYFGDTFDLRDEQELLQRNELTLQGGNARILQRRFEHSSIEAESPNSSSSSSAYITVPRTVESPETYMFLGFEMSTAMLLWNKWRNLDADLKEDFTDFFHFSQLWLEDHANQEGNNAFREDDDWGGVLDRLGIDLRLRAAILDPEFEDIRLTASALYWIQDAMNGRWDYLQDGRKASRLRARRGSNMPFSYATGSGMMFPSGTNVPGTTTLWRAVTRSQARQLWPRSGGFNLDAIISERFGDFNGRLTAYYFTPQLEGAQRYARFRQNSNNPQPIYLVRVVLANSFIEQCAPLILNYPSDMFKKVLWLSRRGKSTNGVVDEASRANLIIGDTSKSTNSTFSDMPEPDGWRMVSERHLLKVMIDGEDTVVRQYVFADKIEQSLADACKDSIEIRRPERTEERIMLERLDL